MGTEIDAMSQDNFEIGLAIGCHINNSPIVADSVWTMPYLDYELVPAINQDILITLAYTIAPHLKLFTGIGINQTSYQVQYIDENQYFWRFPMTTDSVLVPGIQYDSEIECTNITFPFGVEYSPFRDLPINFRMSLSFNYSIETQETTTLIHPLLGDIIIEGDGYRFISEPYNFSDEELGLLQTSQTIFSIGTISRLNIWGHLTSINLMYDVGFQNILVSDYYLIGRRHDIRLMFGYYF